jgi:hypothetical protein
MRRRYSLDTVRCIMLNGPDALDGENASVRLSSRRESTLPRQWMTADTSTIAFWSSLTGTPA